MKTYPTLCAATAALALLASPGCKSHPDDISAHEGGAYAPRNATRKDLENRIPFVLLDPAAQRSVTCSGVQQRTLPDGRLEVAAHVRNRLDRRIEVQINCEFKDDQGFVVDSTPFQTLILSEKAQEDVRFTSLNNQAKRFTIRVRQAR